MKSVKCGAWFFQYISWIHTSDTIFRDLDDYTYSCESILGELDLGEDFKDVESGTMLVVMLLKNCTILLDCIYCGVDRPFTSEDHYPQCEACSSHEPLKKSLNCIATHFVTLLSVYNFNIHLQHVIWSILVQIMNNEPPARMHFWGQWNGKLWT